MIISRLHVCLSNIWNKINLSSVLLAISVISVQFISRAWTNERDTTTTIAITQSEVHYNAPACHPSKCQFPVGNLNSYMIQCSLGARESPRPKRHLDRFRRFFTAHRHVQHTDAKRTVPDDIFSNDSPHLLTACWRCLLVTYTTESNGQCAVSTWIESSKVTTGWIDDYPQRLHTEAGCSRVSSVRT